jgi:hypothetical protein
LVVKWVDGEVCGDGGSQELLVDELRQQLGYGDEAGKLEWDIPRKRADRVAGI